jgi:cell wall-associated NlpC family hydrolase
MIDVDADGESMATDWQDRRGPARRTHPWWRPLAISAVATASIAALFNPLPASAAPQVPGVPQAPAVPDAGSRPIALGTLVMPGQVAATPTTTPGVATSPIQAQRDKMQAGIAALGDQLIQAGQDRDLAKQQQTVANQKVTDARTALAEAQSEAAAAASASLRDAAALPPGAFGSDLQGLDALAQLQRGEPAGEESAARHLALAQAAMTAAQTEQSVTAHRAIDVTAAYAKLQSQIAIKQAALQKFERDHAADLSLADAAETAQDQALGAQYLQGANQGRGADARAIGALKAAITRIGDPYVWSEEGPHQFDCSGLMQWAYKQPQAGGFQLQRVSRDQYWQTHNKVVDRYSLLPGDLLFFSYSNSWTDIHHVAMYAGNGMMVEAPRTGLDVRLTPVRWTRLFQATRVYGSVDGPVQGPDLSNVPTESNGSGTGNGNTATPSPTVKPSPTRSTKPPTSPSGSPSPTRTSTSPSTSPSPSGTTNTTTPPTTASPTGTPSSATTSPTGGSSGSSTGSSPSGSGSSSAGSSSPAGSTSSAGGSSSASTSSSASSSSSAHSSTSASAGTSKSASAPSSAASSTSAAPK